MKRILLSMIVASGLAMTAVAPANATIPLCGKSYAMIMQGADGSTVQADGTATQPGAITAAVGVGEITLDATCSTGTGELIYNSGDIQSTTPGGVFFGPAQCYTQLFGFGVPCFDGANHFTLVSVTPSTFGNGSFDLKFTAGFAVNEGVGSPGTAAFDFTVQPGTGGAIVVGTSVPPTATTTASTATPVLSLTMQKIGNPGAVATTFGAAPYLGNSVNNILTFGSNSSDFISSAQASAGNGIAGGVVSTTSALEIFSNGFAGGSVTFNSNDNIQATAGTVTSSNDCAFALAPANNCSNVLNANCVASGDPYPNCTGAGTGTNACGAGPDPAQFAFPDGTSNVVAFFVQGGSDCNTLVTNPGVGFSLSSVQFGATDATSYTTVTAFYTAATGFTPGVGGSGAGTNYASSPPGKLSTALTVQKNLNNVAAGVPVTSVIKVTSTTPAQCNVSLVQTGGGPLSDGNCALSVVNSPASVPGDVTLSTTVGGAPTFSCVCGAVEDAVGISANFQAQSNCPIAVGGVAQIVTCQN